MMAQSRAENTRDTYNYGQYINQFPPNMIKVIREFERIQKKICRHKMSIMFNEICINEEMLPKYTYIYIYIYHHHHHHHHHQVMLMAQIPLNLFSYPSLLAITSGRSSGLHSKSSQNPRSLLVNQCWCVHV